MRMRILSDPADLQPGGQRVCVAIGMFDGVHLGHQQVLRQTLADAQQHNALAVAVTFDRHPESVLAPDRAPPLLYPLSAKLRALAAAGLDATWMIPFDLPFSRIPPDTFVRTLAASFGPLYSLCVGSQFTFGHRRAGNIETLRTLGRDLRFLVHGIAAVSLDGEPVSSTRIRNRVRHADFDAASQMLGRPYALTAPVVAGRKLGRSLGFPTANLDTAGLVLPPSGVYAAHVRLAHQLHSAVLNIGSRPTLASPDLNAAPTVEVHLLDFNADLYGQDLEVCFVTRLRDEQRFPNLPALQTQIQADIAAARQIFNGPGPLSPTA